MEMLFWQMLRWYLQQQIDNINVMIDIGLDVGTLSNSGTIQSYDLDHISYLDYALWSRDGVVVKLLACEARVPGFDSQARRYDFRDWLSPASKSRYGWNTAKAT